MNRLGLILGTLLASHFVLTGCAPVVVGGAATTVSVAHDRRTSGSVIEDQAIEMRIYNRLSEDEEINQQAHINVTSYDGIVLLSGEAPSEALRTRAGQIARDTEKVRRVHNEIQIAAPSSMMTRSSDSWICCSRRFCSVTSTKASNRSSSPWRVTGTALLRIGT